MSRENQLQINAIALVSDHEDSGKIFEKARTFPEPTQTALLKLIESIESQKTSEKPKPKFGSAKELIHIPPDFDEALEDFKPYME